MMFIKSMKKETEIDKILIDTMNRYNNIYTAMNFDNQPSEVRKPVKLPERLQLNLENNSSVNIKKRYGFSNCRPILTGLINGNVKVGITNVLRNSDGIIRKLAPIMEYQDNYYPNLTFGAASNYITEKETNNFVIDRSGNLLIGTTQIPLTKDGEAILNWYGQSGTHTVYPLYKVINQMENKNLKEKRLSFKDKVIIVGTTAMSLHDTKSVPIQEGVYTGVEVHATFFNNMLDNNFIKQTNTSTNSLIALGVITIVGLIVMSSTSTIFAVTFSLPPHATIDNTIAATNNKLTNFFIFHSSTL